MAHQNIMLQKISKIISRHDLDTHSSKYIPPNKIFEDLFKSLLFEMYKKTKNKFHNFIEILDSTTITMNKNQSIWAKYNSKKAGVKVHVLLNQKNSIPTHVGITNANVSDIKYAKNNIDFKKKHIYVMDRAYFCYKWLPIFYYGKFIKKKKYIIKKL